MFDAEEEKKYKDALIESIKSIVSNINDKPDQDIDLPDQICDSDPCVYIGSHRAASNPKTYSQVGITHVINCAGSEYTKKYPKSIKTLSIKARDGSEYPIILKHLNQVITFFETNGIQDNKYMFHCLAGINRSVTLCISYLMYYHKQTVLDTVQTVQKGRTGIILINQKFVQQLAELQIVLESQDLIPSCRDLLVAKQQ